MFITKINLFNVDPFDYNHYYYILIQDIWLQVYRSKKLEVQNRLFLPMSARHFSECIIDDENNDHNCRSDRILTTLNNTDPTLFKAKCVNFSYSLTSDLTQAINLIQATRSTYHERSVSL